MSSHLKKCYAAQPETSIFKATNSRQKVNTVLYGTWLTILNDETPGWYKVRTVGPDGWVRREDTSDEMGFKAFFIDVGQGDGCLIEAPGHRLLIDGGPRKNTYAYLKNWKYKWLIKKQKKVHFDAMVVSHFDFDHFAGLTYLLKDESFIFKTIYHNGIARFNKDYKKLGFNTDLGNKDNSDFLTTSFSNIKDAQALLKRGGLMKTFERFLQAAVKAHKDGRVGAMKKLTNKDEYLPGFGKDNNLTIEILGPIMETNGTYKWFKDSSHTRNGHSVVMKLIYGEKSLLLGGDLNCESEIYLLKHYGEENNPFKVDIAKSCHHGSSEFTVDFMKRLSPFATIFSSGDNESYDHPRADAIGAAGKYSRGIKPLVFSTELARSINSAEDIHYGMIHMRTNGKNFISLSVMKENKKNSDLWSTFTLK